MTALVSSGPALYFNQVLVRKTQQLGSESVCQRASVNFFNIETGQINRQFNFTFPQPENEPIYLANGTCKLQHK